MAGHTAYDLWMLCPDNDYRIKRDTVENRLLVHTVPSVPFTEGIHIFSPSPARINRVYQLLDEIKPDIVHSHNIDPLSFVVQGWCLKSNTPFVYTGHVLASKYNEWNVVKLGEVLEYLTKISLDAYTRQFYKNCTKIISLNEMAREDFRKFINNSTKLEVIPNGYVFKSVPKKVNFGHDPTFRLLYSGYLSERKNQAFLIEMMKHLDVGKPVTLLLAGTYVESSYQKIIEKSCSSLPQNREVRFLGFVDHEKLIKMLADVHFFVSAAKNEVQSLSVIEALASGTPVIALPNPTTTDLIKNGYNGYVLPPDATPQEFARVLSRYLKISQLKYNSLSIHAVNSVDFLRYDQIVPKYHTFYSKLLSTDRPRKYHLMTFEYILSIFDPEKVKKLQQEGSHTLFLGAVSTVVRPALKAVALSKKLMPKQR